MSFNFNPNQPNQGQQPTQQPQQPVPQQPPVQNPPVQPPVQTPPQQPVQQPPAQFPQQQQPPVQYQQPAQPVQYQQPQQNPAFNIGQPPVQPPPQAPQDQLTWLCCLRPSKNGSSICGGSEQKVLPNGVVVPPLFVIVTPSKKQPNLWNVSIKYSTRQG